MLDRLLKLYRQSPFLQWGPARKVLKSCFKLPLRGIELATGFSTCSQDPLPYRLRVLLGLDEPETTGILKHLCLPPRSVILDVGANVGEYSRLFAKLSPQSTFYSFEPNPDTYRILAQNLDKLPACHPVHAALGRVGGVAHLSIHPGLSAVSSIIGPSAAAGDDKISTREVTVINGSDFLSRHHISGIDLLKIDVEGFEHEVLLGLEHAINNSPRVVAVVELNPKSQSSGPGSVETLYTQLQRLAFRVFECGKFSEVSELCDQDEFRRLVDLVGGGYTNLICFKGFEQDQVATILNLQGRCCHVDAYIAYEPHVHDRPVGAFLSACGACTVSAQRQIPFLAAPEVWSFSSHVGWLGVVTLSGRSRSLSDPRRPAGRLARLFLPLQGLKVKTSRYSPRRNECWLNGAVQYC